MDLGFEFIIASTKMAGKSSVNENKGDAMSLTKLHLEKTKAVEVIEKRVIVAGVM
jgi:hypothetical protein